MAQVIPPVQQLAFHGVHTAGNPALRPRGTASVCSDFRVMPGYWLRTRGGRKFRGSIGSGGTVQQLMIFREPGFYGSDSQFAQMKYPDTSVELVPIELTSPAYLIPVKTSVCDPIATAYDSGFAQSNPIPWCNLLDRAVYYNGWGVRGASDSKPALSVYQPYVSIFHYFGLDAYCPSGNPSAAFVAGAGENEVLNSVDIYVGLYNSVTDHYSNGVCAGTIQATAGKGTITVSNLDRLKCAYHNVAERNELYYVFYATIDGGQMPYLILASTLDGPHKVAVTNTSADLSIEAGTTNGWVLDTASEVPQENYPPRPMRSVWYLGGRLYGILMDGGSGSAVAQKRPLSDGTPLDFKYQPETREYAAVCWSRSAGDGTDTDLLGDPLQCWPFKNLDYTPSLEQPVFGVPAADGARSVVVTPTATFYLEEQADGLHEWTRISPVHGGANPLTHQATAYGNVWVDQRNQIVLLRPGSLAIEVLSRNYQSLLAGKTVVCSDYLVDPKNEIERYEVFCSDGTSVIHDFVLRNEQAPLGEGYSATGRAYTGAMSAVDWNGRQHHIVANTAFYTQEAQPEDGEIPTTDENADLSLTQIDGEYTRNWDDFGDSSLRKEIEQVDLIGDGAVSTALGDESPLSVEHYTDFEQVAAGNKDTLAVEKTDQSDTDSAYMAKPVTPHGFWHKFVLKLRGHSTDDASFATHTNPATQGDLAKNFYGSILALRAHVAALRANRP